MAPRRGLTNIHGNRGNETEPALAKAGDRRWRQEVVSAQLCGVSWPERRRHGEEALGRLAAAGRSTTERRNTLLEDHERQCLERDAVLQPSAGTPALAVSSFPSDTKSNGAGRSRPREVDSRDSNLQPLWLPTASFPRRCAFRRMTGTQTRMKPRRKSAPEYASGPGSSTITPPPTQPPAARTAW